MKSGEVFYANTHADFLNKNFGTNYKAWMKCAYPLNTQYEVWMARFDGKVRDGWKNSYHGEIIKDENIDTNRQKWSGIPLPHTLYYTKLVFEIIDDYYSGRKYFQH